MKHSRMVLLMLTALLCGFVGGFASNARSSAAQALPTKIPYIQTGRLELLDPSGKVRIRLAVRPENGAAGLILYDSAHSNPRIIVQVQPDGTSNIQLQDENGQRRASFDYLTQGVVRLVLINSSLSGGTVLGTNNSPLLTLSDHNDKVRAAFGLSSSDNPNLQLLNGSGSVLWSAPTTANPSSQPQPPDPTHPNQLMAHRKSLY